MRSEGAKLEDVATWNTLLALLKGKNVPVSNYDYSQTVSSEEEQELREVAIG